MKYTLFPAVALMLSATLAAASPSYGDYSRRTGSDCGRFQSTHEIQTTPGAMEMCHDRYVQLRMLNEHNDKDYGDKSRL